MNVLTVDNSKRLLFVSGMFAGGWIWGDTYPKIHSATHHIIDDPLCDIGNNVETLAQEISQVVKGIDGSVTLIGNSLGSLVCLYVAKLVPDKISEIIISGSAGFGQIDLGIKLTRHDSESLSKKLTKLVCFDHKKISAEAEKKTADSFRGNFKNIIKLIKESNRIKAEQVIDEISCPIHAIWGSNDVITPHDDVISIFKKFNIALTMIDECGHSPMYEKPDEFAEIVNNILR